MLTCLTKLVPTLKIIISLDQWISGFAERFKDLESLNLIMVAWFRLEPISTTVSKNDICFKGVQKQLKNNHFSFFV